ncbi:MAG: hypothetical protein WC642_15050, partial [Nocardioides sp.]
VPKNPTRIVGAGSTGGRGGEDHGRPRAQTPIPPVSKDAMSTTRTRLTALTAALLLFAGMLGLATATSGAASAAPDRLAEPAATTTSVVMTAPDPMTVHAEVTVTTADGPTPEGTIQVYDAQGNWLLDHSLSGGTAVFDWMASTSGETTWRVTYLPAIPELWAPSEGAGTTVVAGHPTEIVLSTEDLGGGVLRLSAVVDGVEDQDQVLFEIAGHPPVVGERGRFIGLDGWTGRRHAYEAVVDVGGLAMGSYDVTATLAAGPTWAGSSDRATAVLSKKKHVSMTFLYLTSTKRREVLVETFYGVYYPKKSTGTITVRDTATNKVVAVFKNLPAGRVGHEVIKATPGRHTYRAVFTPRPDLRTTLSGSRAQGTVTVRR